ncbi:MAG: PAS domain S-box protein [Promethearchaeota archaeon]
MTDIAEEYNLKEKLRKSEEIYRIIAENASDMILILDQRAIIEYSNELVCKKILGYSNDEVMGKNALEGVHPDDLENITKIFRESFNEREGKGELRYKHKNGNYIWLDVRGKVFKDKDSKRKLLLLARDITDRKHTQLRLSESEEFFRTIAEQSLMGILINLEGGRLIYANQAALNIFESTNEEMLNWTTKDFLNTVHPDDLVALMEIVYNSKFYSSHRMISKSGKVKWIEIFKTNFRYKGKNAFLIIIIDITEKKKAENTSKKNERFLSNIFTSIQGGLCIIDKGRNIIQVNQTMESWFSEKLPLVGKKCYEVYKNRTKPCDDCVCLKTYKFGKDSIEIVSNQIKHEISGKLFEIHSFPLYNQETSNIEGVIEYFHDITEQKKIQQELKESEEKYRNLLESSPMAVIEIDARTNQLSYVNPKLEKITGYSKKDLIDLSTMANMIHPLDFLDITRSTHDRELEFRITTKDGKLKWLSGNRVGHYNEKGELINLRLWLEDVTEKKIFNTLLFELNANFLKFGTEIQKNIILLLNSAQRLLNAEVVLYCKEFFQDGNKQIQFISSQNEIFDYNYDFFKENCFIHNLFNIDNDFPQILVNLNEYKSAKTDPIIQRYKVNGYYGKHIKPQSDLKSLICILYKDYPYISEKDQFILFSISTAIEIEERRWQSILKLEEQNKRLNEIHNLKSELFTRISHELKTPLLSIKGFTDLLLELYMDEFEDNIISIFKEIDHGRERLEDIVNSFLETSQLDSGRLILNKSRENLSFLINYCVNELKGLIHSRKQTINLNLEGNFILEFDKEKIYEVIMNLLTNAIKNTPREGEITIDSKIKNNSIVTKVEDNGIGLTEEEMDQLFKQFGKIERYGKGWDVGIEGTGLGLYISKKIVDLHGGEIWAESEGRNKGSKFYFSLPLIEK